jgi:hypothetical protein
MNHAVLEFKLQIAELKHHSPWICRDSAPKKAGTPPLYGWISETHRNRSYKLSISFNIIRQMLKFTQYTSFYLSFLISTWTFQDGFSPFKNDTTNSLPTEQNKTRAHCTCLSVSAVHENNRCLS